MPLPAPGRSPTETPWKSLLELDPAFEPPARNLSTAEREVWVRTTLQRLRSHEAIAPGSRVVLFIELDHASSADKTWQDAIQKLMPLIPKRLGVVISGAPRNLERGSIRPDDPHLAITSADFLPEAPPEESYRYLDVPLSGDQPATWDLLDVDWFADGLARLIMHPATQPLTIGVHGPWGSGKSSFMTMVKQRLVERAQSNAGENSPRLKELEDRLHGLERVARIEPADMDSWVQVKHRDVERQRLDHLARMETAARPDVLTVNFNAWEYDNATQTWAGLASEITKAMEEALPTRKRLMARLSYSLGSRTPAQWLRVVVLLAVVMGGLLFLAQTTWAKQLAEEQAKSFSPLFSLVPGGIAIAVFLGWRLAKEAVPLSERILQHARAPDYRDQLGLQSRVLSDLAFVKYQLQRFGPRAPDGRSRVRRALSSTRRAITWAPRRLWRRIRRRPPPPKQPLSPGPRVVVFIDDLDRCSDEKVVEILQAINLILAKSSFYVVVGMDTEMIYKAINDRHKVAEERRGQKFAENYLRKIVQLQFHLPTTAAKQRIALVSQMFSPAARRDLGDGSDGGRNGSTGPAEATEAIVETVDGAAPQTARAAALSNLFAYNSAILLKPKSTSFKEVEDTKYELKAFRDFAPFLSENPRELKRLINVLRLVRILLVRPDAPLTPVMQRKLVAWLVFCARWGDLVDDAFRMAQSSTSALGDGIKDLAKVQAHGPTKDELLRFAASFDGATITNGDLRPEELLFKAAFVSQRVSDDPPADAPQTVVNVVSQPPA
jgi:hypothetical protein